MKVEWRPVLHCLVTLFIQGCRWGWFMLVVGGGQGRGDAIGWLISEGQAGGGTGVQIGWSEGMLFSDWWGRYS